MNKYKFIAIFNFLKQVDCIHRLLKHHNTKILLHVEILNLKVQTFVLNNLILSMTPSYNAMENEETFTIMLLFCFKIYQ